MTGSAARSGSVGARRWAAESSSQSPRNLAVQRAAGHPAVPATGPAAGLPLEAALGLLLVGGAARRLARRHQRVEAGAASR